MTIADDNQNPRPQKKLAQSLDALVALRNSMQKRLDEKPVVESQPEPVSEVNEPSPASAADAASAPSPAYAGEGNDALSPASAAAAALELSPATPEKPVEVAPMIEEPIEPPKEEPIAAPKIEEPKEQPKAAPNEPHKEPEHKETIYDPVAWSRIMRRVAEESHGLMTEYLERNKDTVPPALGLDPSHFSEAIFGLTNGILAAPEHFVDTQLAIWQGYVNIWQNMLGRAQGKPAPDVITPPPFDKRFLDREWQNNWLFDFLKQLYLLVAKQSENLIHEEVEKLDPKVARKLEFFTRQMVDAGAPTNFWLTNPEVLRSIFESGGENLIKGFENLLQDLERGHGQLVLNLVDANSFEIGKNLAATPGQVVFQNDLIQLIQYEPATPDVHKVPLLIIPPWINKFYILDLQKKNSFIAWLVDQGYTVFCVSWANPDARFAQANFDDYMTDGALAAMTEVRRATGVKDINVLGYCIGGTLLASTLAYLKSTYVPPPDLPNVLSATYLVTMVDFKEPGDLGVFIDEETIKYAEENMARRGYMDAPTIMTVFNLLRANDLIWSHVINNYLLGKGSAPFDILYWNSDSTNLPATMQSYYLRNMYLDNKLVAPNALQMKGVPIDVTAITVPSFLLSTREDHIAPWKSTYAATQLYKGPVKFTLAASGHIAGIVNPPANKKYGYWTNDTCPGSPEAWLKDAKAHDGSWWPEWVKWLAQYAGEKVPARAVRNGLEPAPGSYVKVRVV